MMRILSLVKSKKNIVYLKTKTMKTKYKKMISDAAFYLLEIPTEEAAEKWINEELGKMGLPDGDANWEASEYLRRFYKTFVSHGAEVLLAPDGATGFA